MVDEVGSFVEEAVGVSVDGFDCRFDGFFADFPRYLLDAFDEEARGIGVLGHQLMTLGDESGKGADEAFGVMGVET